MSVSIEATVERDGRWWVIRVPEYDISGQAARLSEAESVAREITSLWLGIEEEDVVVSLTQRVPDDVTLALRQAEEEGRAARELAAHAASVKAAAVRRLLQTGMHQNEAAELIGVSRQRIAQIARAGQEV
ncbi:hypothetical protein ACT3SZ_14250 [Corynebacterium sp. AOP40-9SA-29]|uniref:hypothetical protein n=1 Tax=Corynebacterium sp. AOP40-9SA-29 TaxID=3457677 RepID=UPI004034199A